MPTGTEPQDTFTLIPLADQTRPTEQQRRFEFRHRTAREWKRAVRLLDGLDSSIRGPDALDTIEAELATTLIGWQTPQGTSNGDIAGSIQDILGPEEVVEMFQRMVMASRLSGADRKNSESPSLSAAESSAANAVAANAETSPASSSPSSSNAMAVEVAAATGAGMV